MESKWATVSKNNNSQTSQNSQFSPSLNKLKEKVLLDDELNILEIPDQYLINLLNYEKNNVDQSFENLKCYFRFRLNYTIGTTNRVRKSEIKPLLDCNIAKWYGTNKKGYPCLIIISKNLIKTDHSLDSLTKFVIYTLDKGSKEMRKRNVNKFCVIGDRDDYDKEKNFVPEFSDRIKPYAKAIFALLFDYIDFAYIINISFFWRMMFEVAKKFIEPHVLSKVIMLGDCCDLSEYFDLKSLPAEYCKVKNSIFPIF